MEGSQTLVWGLTREEAQVRAGAVRCVAERGLVQVQHVGSSWACRGVWLELGYGKGRCQWEKTGWLKAKEKGRGWRKVDKDDVLELW